MLNLGDLGFIQEDNPKPIYVQVSDWMRENIHSGTWQPHEKLPAESDLAVMLGISRGTLKNAISAMVQEGLLVQSHGKGTYVAGKKLSHPFAQELVSFFESMRRQGVSFDTDVISQVLTSPKASVCRDLSVNPEDSVLFLKRLRVIDEDPVILLENYVNPRVCRGIERVDFTQRSLFEEIERTSGSRIAGGERRFEARLIDADLSKYFGLPAGFPILYFHQVVYLTNGTPVETSDVWLRSDKYDVISRFDR